MAKKVDLSEEIALLRGMDTYLRNHCQDEEIFARWIYTVPDECSDEDLFSIADESESFHEVLRLFAEILLEDENA